MNDFAILMSIKPEQCEKIANGDKTLEIRKPFPDKVGESAKNFKPFKVYMYCNKKRYGDVIRVISPDTAEITGTPVGNLVSVDKEFRDEKDITVTGTVFGEFTCTGIVDFDVPCPAYRDSFLQECKYILDESNMSYDELRSYAKEKRVCGFKIEDVKLYDKPKSIYDYSLHGKSITLNKAPQTWCYVNREENV